MQHTEAIPGGLEQAHIWPGVLGSQLGPKAFWEGEEGEEESEKGRRASSRQPQGWDHLLGGSRDNSWGKPCHLVGGRRCQLPSQCVCGLPHQAGKRQEPTPRGAGTYSPGWRWGQGLRWCRGEVDPDGTLPNLQTLDGAALPPQEATLHIFSALLPASNQPLRLATWHVQGQVE